MVKIKKELFIGIDFGTSFTKVYLRNTGIIDELPTVVALDKRKKTLIAFGEEAKMMIGRNPQNIEVVRPVFRGVVSYFDEALIFLEAVLNRIKKEYFSLFGSKIIFGIPLDLTEVQKRGVIDVGLSSGAKKVYLVEEPVAAALGANLDIEEAKGILIVDIGGGTTDIALISLGGVVIGKSVRIGGDVFNESIINYVKMKYGLIIGEGQAEQAKVHIGTILIESPKSKVESGFSFILKGRDILTGLPKEVVFRSQDLREAILENLNDIAVVIKDILNLAPPDLLGDISTLGVYLSGGGSLIKGLNNFLEKEVKIKINLVDEPRYAVIRGIGKILEDFNNYQKLLINV